MRKETWMCPRMYAVVNVNICAPALSAGTAQCSEHTENQIAGERSWELVDTRTGTGNIGSRGAGKEMLTKQVVGDVK